MKFLILYLFSFLALFASSPLPLESYKWKSRILLVFSNQDYTKVWLKEKEDILARDLVYYQFKKDGTLLTNEKSKTKLSNSDLLNIHKALKPKAPSEIILIGKDGDIKKRAKSLKLDEVFALIDTMPMRQEEMRSR